MGFILAPQNPRVLQKDLRGYSWSKSKAELEHPPILLPTQLLLLLTGMVAQRETGKFFIVFLTLF